MDGKSKENSENLKRHKNISKTELNNSTLKHRLHLSFVMFNERKCKHKLSATIFRSYNFRNILKNLMEPT